MVRNDPRLTAGVRWMVAPTDRTFGIEVRRSPESTSTGNPSTASSLYVTIARLLPGVFEVWDPLPRDGFYRYYSGRHYLSGYDPSTWSSSWVKAKPDTERTSAPRQATVEGRRRVDTLYSQDKSLAGDVTQAGRVLARGYLSGQAQDADAVEFSPNFSGAPMVSLRGGISYEPRSTKWLTSTGGASTKFNSTKPQYDQLQALNLTSTGMTVKAKLRQKVTAESTKGDDFSTGNSLTATGQTANCNLATPPASDDQYTVHLSATVSVKPSTKHDPQASCQAKVQIRSNDGGGWVVRTTRTYTAVAEGGSSQTEIYPHDQPAIIVSGLSTGDDIDLKLDEINVTGAGATTSVAIHGYSSTDSNSGVTYVTSTGGDIFASKTPDGGDTVTWEAFEVT